MRQNLDYVSMGDYKADMKESTDTALRAIAFMKDRAERAEKLLARVLLAAGKVTLSDFDLQDDRPIEMITWRNEADRTLVLEAKLC